MNTKNVFLVATVITLAAIYVFFFTDWFKPQHLEIFHTSRSMPASRFGPRVRAGNANTAIVQFGLNGAYRLTEIKVIDLNQWKTNPSVLPMWHMVTDSNSVPVKIFPYGVAIGGMRPLVGNEWAKPLEPNTTYRIIVSSGKRTGEHDFVTIAKSERDNTPPPARPVRAANARPANTNRVATVQTNR